MDPILQVVSYLFMKNNITNIEDSFYSFFDDGISFPNLLAIAFNIDKVPKIMAKPSTIFHKSINNNIACQYLFEKNSEIARISPNFATPRDQANMISLILTKIIFKMSFKEIIDKCNQIILPLNKSFKSKKELLDVKSLLMLLNVLTDGKVPYDFEIINVDQTLTQSFEIAKAPLVINETSLQFQNQFLFFIQIQIIFDHFSEKIHLNQEESIKNDQTTDLQQENQNKSQMNDNQNETKIDKLKPIKTQEEDQKQKADKEEYSEGFYEEEEEEENLELFGENEIQLSNTDNKSNEENATEETNGEDGKSETKGEDATKETNEEDDKSDINEKDDKEDADEENNKTEIKIEESKTETKTEEIPKTKDKNVANKKRKGKIKYLEDDDIKLEKMNEEVLLKTLNMIGKKVNIHFDDLFQTVESEKLIKFVKYLVKDDEIDKNPEYKKIT